MVLEGRLPYICVIKVDPTWISGLSCRYLDWRETPFCVHIRNPYSTHSSVAAQTAVSLLGKWSRGSRHIYFSSVEGRICLWIKLFPGCDITCKGSPFDPALLFRCWVAVVRETTMYLNGSFSYCSHLFSSVSWRPGFHGLQTVFLKACFSCLRYCGTHLVSLHNVITQLPEVSKAATRSFNHLGMILHATSCIAC